jgi:hypothetical protein
MEKKDKGAVDLAKALGRSFISGAYDIERRVHWSGFIYVEYSKYDNEPYLEIKRDKVKYKRTGTDYLVHHLQNGFIIEDDYGTDRILSRGSIIPEDNNGSYTQGARDLGSRGVSSISQMSMEVAKETNKSNFMMSSTSSAASSATSEFNINDFNIACLGEPSYTEHVTPFNLPQEGDLKPDRWVIPWSNIF